MKPEVKFSLAIAILFCLGGSVLGWRSFKIIFTTFPFTFNQDFVDAKIQIQNDSAGDASLNVVFSVNDEIDDVNLSFTIALENDEGKYTALVNHTVNFCKFLKQRSTEPFLRLVYEDILKHGNFMKSCPIKKGSYSIREYRIDEEKLPSYIPETSFFMDIQLDKDATNLFKGRLHGKIDKSKGFNNLKMFSLG